MPVNITRYDTAAVVSGANYDRVQQAYNRFAQLVSSAQEHGGAASGSSPTVGLGDANGSSNTFCPTGMDYFSGRELTE